MNWMKTLNKASEYIESHLDQDLKLEDIAKECNVSYHYFTKIFSLLTGYTLKEYIRNRRITIASYEVSHSNDRIIDIAIKYGYSSNEAFTRAFKKIHGINPSYARKNNVTVYTHFPVLHFEANDNTIVSLRYDVIKNIDLTLFGISTSIVEVDYKQTQERLLDFVTEFGDTTAIPKPYILSPLLYRVHYNLSADTKIYQYFVGTTDPNLIKDGSFEKKEIHISKAIRFISKSIEMDQIPKVKQIIYDEWYKNDFVNDLEYEVEYVIKNEDNLIDYYYLVSVL